MCAMDIRKRPFDGSPAIAFTLLVTIGKSLDANETYCSHVLFNVTPVIETGVYLEMRYL